MTDQQHQTIARVTRYQITCVNTAARFRKAFENHRKSTVAERTSREKLTIDANERAQSAINKTKPESTSAENLPQHAASSHSHGLRSPRSTSAEGLAVS